MDTYTNGTTLPINRVIMREAKTPYLTREEWEVYKAAMLTYIDMNRRADLMRVEAAEMLAAAMGKPYKRAKGKE